MRPTTVALMLTGLALVVLGPPAWRAAHRAVLGGRSGPLRSARSAPEADQVQVDRWHNEGGASRSTES